MENSKQLSAWSLCLPACRISESVQQLIDLALDTLCEAVGSSTFWYVAVPRDPEIRWYSDEGKTIFLSVPLQLFTALLHRKEHFPALLWRRSNVPQVRTLFITCTEQIKLISHWCCLSSMLLCFSIQRKPAQVPSPGRRPAQQLHVPGSPPAHSGPLL